MVNLEKGFGGAIDFFGAMADGSMRARRDEAMNEDVNNHTIDTCVPGDTRRWETGVKRKDTWIIVEDYADEKAAKIGHKKWVNKIKKNPKCELKDTDMWGLNKDNASSEGEKEVMTPYYNSPPLTLEEAEKRTNKNLKKILKEKK